MPPRPEHRHLDATRFLRGIQGTDKLGRVEFRTLYPGWYSGRAIHIHLKVHPDFKAGETANIGSHVCHTRTQSLYAYLDAMRFLCQSINDRSKL
jgi:protocatechuate 3,4-dioxygenase beta subunit